MIQFGEARESKQCFFFSLATRWLKYQQDFISKTESRGELSARMVESTKRFLIMSEKVRGHQYSV